MAEKTIMAVKNMQAVQARITQRVTSPDTTLVAFDVDWTLTVSPHPALHCPNMAAHQKVLDKILARLNEIDQDKVCTLAVQAYGQQLVEPNIPTILQAVQQQGIKTMAFTASLVGQLPALGHLTQRRFQDLQALGIDFRQAFAAQEVVLTTLPAFNENYPTYHQGILYANNGRGQNNKGNVLVTFLKKMGYQPQLIIMVDDLAENLVYIQQALATFNPTIQFLGIEYRGAKDYAPKTIDQEAFTAFWEQVAEKITATL